MIVTWLIYMMIVKGYVSGNSVDDWTESPKAWLSLNQNAINQCSPSCKYSSSSSIDDSYLNLNLNIGSISDFQKSQVIKSAFPETSYPLSILDSTQPFYFITDAQDNILGPFTKDIQNVYKSLTSKSYCQEQKSNPDILKNDSKITAMNATVNETQTVRTINVFDIVHIEQELIEITNTSRLELNLELEDDDNTSIQVDIEMINENKTFTKKEDATSIDGNYIFNQNKAHFKEDINEIYVEEEEFDNCLNDFATINETPSFEEQLSAPPLFNELIELEEITKSFISEERENVEYYIDDSEEIAKCANVTYLTKMVDIESTSNYSSIETTESTFSSTY